MIKLGNLEKEYSKRELNIAFHEAGHVVSAWHSKFFRPHKVYFTSKGGMTETINNLTLKNWFKLFFSDEMEVDDAKNDMAGFYTEWYFFGIERYSGCKEDRKHAIKIIKRLKRKHTIYFLQKEIINFIRQKEEDIFQIALALLEKEVLNYSDIKCILKKEIDLGQKTKL